MTVRELIQDLLAHAHEAPAQCAALMRRAARELEARDALLDRHFPDVNALLLGPREADPVKKGASCS